MPVRTADPTLKKCIFCVNVESKILLRSLNIVYIHANRVKYLFYQAITQFVSRPVPICNGISAEEEEEEGGCLPVILSITLRVGKMIPHEKPQKKRWECVSVFHPNHPPSTRLPPQAKTKRVIITRPRHNVVSVVARGELSCSYHTGR